LAPHRGESRRPHPGATNINIPEALANKRPRDTPITPECLTLSLPGCATQGEIPIPLKHFMSRM
jgi:hypothetical protein